MEAPPILLNARGLQCPLPVLRARKALLALAPGTVLLLEATDPAAWDDVPAFCAEAGHELRSRDRSSDGLMTFHIKRGLSPR